VLGGPSPENLSSPVSLKAAFTVTLLDLAVGETVAPNRVRTIFAGSPPQTFGTMEFRRKIRNFTGAPVTRLRFRVVNITTTVSAPSRGPEAPHQAAPVRREVDFILVRAGHARRPFSRSSRRGHLSGKGRQGLDRDCTAVERTKAFRVVDRAHSRHQRLRGIAEACRQQIQECGL